MKNNYTVYEHIFPNKYVYVGITRQNPENRWKNGEGYKRQKVYDKIKEYGWDNIQHKILFTNLSQVEACNEEKTLIRKYKKLGISYNVSVGGDLGSNPVCIFNYHGNDYDSNEMAAMSSVVGITGHDITNRINSHGWTLHDALFKKK